MGLTFLGTGSALPELCVDNFDMAKIVDTTDEWMRTRTGIASRHIASHESLTDLITQAARRALDDAGLTPADLDLIIVATMAGDWLVPSAACSLQYQLGATCPAFDLNAACSGFLYGLHTARQFYLAGSAKRILVVGAEMLSRLADWEDLHTCPLFGDGAGAAVLGEGDGDVLESFLTAEGESGESLGCPGAGQSNFPGTPERKRRQVIHMDGRKIFNFAVKHIKTYVTEIMQKVGWTPDDVDWIAPHQANARIIQEAAKKLKMPLEKFLLNIENTGNTSAASVPILLDTMWKNGTIKRGQKIITVAFGGGLTTGQAALIW